MQEKENLSEYRDEQLDVELKAKKNGEMRVKLQANHIEADEGRTVGKKERDAMLHFYVESDVSKYHHKRANTELEQYNVFWDEITPDDVIALKKVLRFAEREEDMRTFLNENKIFLVQHLGGGHGRYVFSKPKLGTQFVPDFLLAELSSMGFQWHGVELESPIAKLFTSDGQPRSELTHAIQQIFDWRNWLLTNSAYARIPTSENGLGLIGIDANLTATILMGRRKEDTPPRFNAYRRQMKQENNIVIHTYDWLVEQATYRA